jgi:hypothetical protein
VVRLEANTDTVAIGTTTPLGKLHVETNERSPAIYAEFTGTDPINAMAVWGKSAPTDGWGVGGFFQGNLAGVRGDFLSTTDLGGIGVWGTAFGGSYINYGVAGEASGDGTNHGVHATAYGHGSDETYGTYSNAGNHSTGDCYAGYFVADDEGFGTDTHTGLRAIGQANSAATTHGVYGKAENIGSGTVRGGYFTAYSAGSGTHYGVIGYEAAGGGGAAVYASGDYVGSGAKYAVVKTGRGHRLLSCMESPEVWFEDFGEGKLVNGKAHVELDPLFLETATINEKHPMKVFVQLKDDCKGTYVKTWDTGFDVYELQGGTSNASFSYRIVAKRKGYENERLRETDVGYDDPTLYPELQAEIDREHEAEKQQRQLEREKRRQEEERGNK